MAIEKQADSTLASSSSSGGMRMLDEDSKRLTGRRSTNPGSPPCVVVAFVHVCVLLSFSNDRALQLCRIFEAQLLQTRLHAGSGYPSREMGREFFRIC